MSQDGLFVNGLAAEGANITVIAAGFDAGDLISLRLNGTIWTSMIAGEDGTATADLEPTIFAGGTTSSIGSGAMQVEVTDSAGNTDYKAPLWIVPKPPVEDEMPEEEEGEGDGS